jgi:hypothetical protein
LFYATEVWGLLVIAARLAYTESVKKDLQEEAEEF